MMRQIRLLLMVGITFILLVCRRSVHTYLPSSDEYSSLQEMDATFFPVGFMGVYHDSPQSEMFSEISATPIEIVHEFRAVQEIEEAEAYLEAADEAGLKVIQNMPTCRAYNSRRQSTCLEEDVEVWGEKDWAQFISTLARHDNLIAWYLPDEIDNYPKAADLYTWAHKYDPKGRPVFGNPGTYRQVIINLFPYFTDFLWTVAYPDYNDEPRALVTYAMRRDAEACQGTDTRWGAILQFFDSNDLGGNGGYPTAHEIRCDSYQAIIGGATGLWYFPYARGQELTDLLAGINQVADEVVGAGELDEVILSPDVTQSITQTIISGPTESPRVRGEVYDSIQALQKEYNGVYLFAVNIASDTVVVEFSDLPSEATTVEVLFEDRMIDVFDGAFRDSFAESDVHIYRVVDSENGQ